MSIDLNNKITDLPNFADKQYEYRMPVIVCPICGDKDHIQLIDYDGEVNNNLQHGYHYIYSTDQTFTHKINGHCNKCGSMFSFSISATVPRDKPIAHKFP